MQLSTPLQDCVVGEPKEITLKVTPTANDSSGFMANVDEVVDYEETDGEKEDQSMQEYKKEGEMKDMKHGPTVVIAIGSKKK